MVQIYGDRGVTKIMIYTIQKEKGEIQMPSLKIGEGEEGRLLNQAMYLTHSPISFTLITITHNVGPAKIPWPFKKPLTFLDVRDGREKRVGDRVSNEQEANMVAKLVKQLVRGTLKPSDVGEQRCGEGRGEGGLPQGF
jgi:hypothetical protein